MKTKFVHQEEADRKWFVVDAQDKVLGRMATRIATVIRGKHKPDFTPNVDGGDFVVVVNAEKVRLTGDKMEKKQYVYHTGYRGGVKQFSAEEMLVNHPEQVIEEAVWGMLPKGKLGRQLINKLKVYRGSAHPHVAQQPKTLEV